jgi:hypothetical protein
LIFNCPGSLDMMCYLVPDKIEKFYGALK